MPRIRSALTVTLFCLLLGCDRKAEPTRSSAAPAPVSSSPAPVQAAPTRPAEPAKGGGIVWKDTLNFERLPNPGPMRKASYRVKKVKEDSDDAELAVFHFGAGQGGGLEANVERWIGQFTGVKPDGIQRSDRSANGLKQHIVEIADGTFKSGMPGGGQTVPKPNYALVGAIVAAPNGNWFFKLTGPRKTVKERRAEFFELLDGVKAE